MSARRRHHARGRGAMLLASVCSTVRAPLGVSLALCAAFILQALPSSAQGAAPSPAAAPSLAAAPPAKPAEQKPVDAKPLEPKPAPARPKPKASRDDTAPRPGLADTVWLKDGTRVHGTLLRVETDNYVVLLGAEGVRTIPWRVVARIESVSNVPAQNVPGSVTPESGSAMIAAGSACCADDSAEDSGAPLGADAFASASLGWDLRAEGVSLFKHYTVGGRGAWYAGEGVGGGGSLSVHFRGPAWLSAGSAVRWGELELGVSDSVHYVSWRQGAPYQTTFFENQTSLIIGAHLASGHWGGEGDAPWGGVVFGVAWLPTYVRLFGSDDFGSSGKFHPAGVRLTVDWGRLALGSKGLLPGLRASLTWLPYVDNLPTAVAVGLGTVFY